MAAVTADRRDSAEYPRPEARPAPSWRALGGVALALLGLTFLMFGPVLFASSHRVLSHTGTDLFSYFLASRAFGAQQIHHGHLPFWNPDLFSGTPFLSNPQAALLYPLNVLFLILPLDRAVNASIALHVFLIGLGAAVWAWRRSLNPAACLVSGALLMFGGPVFLKIYPGHLAPLNAMAWTPWVLMAADAWLETRDERWLLGGAGVVALQILAGHPQSVFNTAVAVLLAAALGLPSARPRLRVCLGLAGLYAGAAALSAAQLLPSLAAVSESTRGQDGVPYAFARTFSLPPENLLTLLAPGLLGDMTTRPYWGRWYLWEVSLFVGVAGLALAVYGVACGPAPARRWGVLALALLVLALGAYTPLYHVLYAHVPGFSRFRGQARFTVPFAAVMALLAGTGVDALWRSSRVPRGLLGGLGGTALGMAASGALLIVNASVWGGPLLRRIAATGESFVPPGVLLDHGFARMSAVSAGHALLMGGALCGLLAVLFFARRFSVNVGYVLAGLAVVEVFAYAHATLETFDLADARRPELQVFLERHPGDTRILNFLPGNGFGLAAEDVWGYDPFVLGRYAAFMAHTQGLDPDSATASVTFTRLSPLFRMLRCRYVIVPGTGEGLPHSIELPGALPHLLLVPQATVVHGRDRILAALDAPRFAPTRSVILETPPRLALTPGGTPGAVRLVSSTPETLTIEADLTRPAILLVTDAYSRGWRADALPGSVQHRYTVQPADYVLRAVPLIAGHHRLRLEYQPEGWVWGVRLSVLAGVVYVTLIAFAWTSRHRIRGGTGS